MEATLENIISLLQDIEEDIDFQGEVALIDKGLLDSFDILQIISSLNEEFDISIPAKDIVPDNFNSAEAMLDLVVTLLDED